MQEYLTEAQCDFAHERAVSARDVQALVKRLEQRLSKGWLRVKVGRELLEPISPALAEPPPPKPEPAPAPEPRVEPAAAPSPPPVAEWDSKVALRELWLALLPHYAWMIAMVLVTLATLLIIWGLRRLGKESLEEKALAAQLAAGSLGGSAPAQADAASAEPSPAPPSAPEGEAAAARAVTRTPRPGRRRASGLQREFPGRGRVPVDPGLHPVLGPRVAAHDLVALGVDLTPDVAGDDGLAGARRGDHEVALVAPAALELELIEDGLLERIGSNVDVSEQPGLLGGCLDPDRLPELLRVERLELPLLPVLLEDAFEAAEDLAVVDLG